MFLYQWLIAFPILLVATILTALITMIGCGLGDGHFWGYYPGRIWSRLFCIVSLVRVKVVGRENIRDNTSYVFVANHQGAYDIFLIYGYLGRNFKWMMKKSLRSIPFVGAACAAAGHIFVDKGSRSKSLHETIVQATETLKEGMSLVVFPEGSRTRDGKMGRFKKGAFQLAVDLRLPVIPLTIDGSYRVMSRDTYRITPGCMTLTIHPPIDPDERQGHDLDRLMSESYEVIASALPEEQIENKKNVNKE